MKREIVLSILIPLAFGFLLFGSGSSGGGWSTGIHSSNKVFMPSIFSGTGSASARATLSFSTRSLFTPNYANYGSQPWSNLNSYGSFRFNFFDP